MIKFFDEEGIISPVTTVANAAFRVREFGAKVAITAFSDHIFNELIGAYGARLLCKMPGATEALLYGMIYEGKPIAVFKSPVGASAAASAAEETLACGIESLIAFGICGALKELPVRSFVVPTESYRDEGTSYHYAPDGEKIALKNAAFVNEKLVSYGLNTTMGGAWCTDGFYRETRSRLNELTARGCIAVDMESSALQAVCDFRKKQFYTFFITADSLAGEEWESNYLLNVSIDSPDTVGVAAAVRLASELA